MRAVSSSASTAAGIDGLIGEFVAQLHVHVQVQAHGPQQLQDGPPAIVLGHRQALAIVRQLHLRTRDFDARSGAGVLLRLRQPLQGLGKLDIGARRVERGVFAQARQIRAGHLLADLVLGHIQIRLGGLQTGARGPILADGGEIQHRHLRGRARVEDAERPHDAGNREPRNRKLEIEAERVQVDGLAALVHRAVDIGKKRRAGLTHVRFRHPDRLLGQRHAGAAFRGQRDVHGALQTQLHDVLRRARRNKYRQAQRENR